MIVRVAGLGSPLVATNSEVIEPFARLSSDSSSIFLSENTRLMLGCAPADNRHPDCLWRVVSVLDPKIGQRVTVSASTFTWPGAMERRVRSWTLRPDASSRSVAHLLEASNRLSGLGPWLRSQLTTVCGFQTGGLGAVCLALDRLAIPFKVCLTNGSDDSRAVSYGLAKLTIS